MGFPCPYVSPPPPSRSGQTYNNASFTGTATGDGFLAAAGSGATKGYGFTGSNTSTGLRSFATDQPAMFVGASGVSRWLAGFQINVSNFIFAWERGSANTLGGTTDVGLASPSAGVISINDGSGTTTNYRDLSTRGDFGGTTKTLTESSATGIADLTIAALGSTSGEFHVTIEAKDAVDTQARHMRVPFVAVNKGGTVTVTMGTPVETVAVSAGTLTCTLTMTAGASKITIAANAVSSLTQTTLQAKWKLVSPDVLSITNL